MSTAAVFLDIKKAFNMKWHSGLLHMLLESEFLTSFIKVIGSFLTDRIFKVLVGGEFSMAREIVAGVPQGSILAQHCTLWQCISPEDLESLRTYYS
jgi:hypothetical protein